MPTKVLSKETYLVSTFLASRFIREVPKLSLNKNYVVWWLKYWTAMLYEYQQNISLRK